MKLNSKIQRWSRTTAETFATPNLKGHTKALQKRQPKLWWGDDLDVKTVGSAVSPLTPPSLRINFVFSFGFMTSVVLPHLVLIFEALQCSRLNFCWSNEWINQCQRMNPSGRWAQRFCSASEAIQNPLSASVPNYKRPRKLRFAVSRANSREFAKDQRFGGRRSDVRM